MCHRLIWNIQILIQFIHRSWIISYQWLIARRSCELTLPFRWEFHLKQNSKKICWKTRILIWNQISSCCTGINTRGNGEFPIKRLSDVWYSFRSLLDGRPDGNASRPGQHNWKVHSVPVKHLSSVTIVTTSLRHCTSITSFIRSGTREEVKIAAREWSVARLLNF